MKFPGKTKRDATPAMRKDIDFEHYSWDTPRQRGWFPMVVLNAQEKETSKGDPMFVVDLGIDIPSEEKGARIRWHVPSTFAPKVEMLMSVLMPELAEEADDVEVDPKTLMFRGCVGLVDIDPDFEREDGEPAWTLVKIIAAKDADAELGADWLAAQGAAAADGDDQADETADAPADAEAMF